MAAQEDYTAYQGYGGGGAYSAGMDKIAREKAAGTYVGQYDPNTAKAWNYYGAPGPTNPIFELAGAVVLTMATGGLSDALGASLADAGITSSAAAKIAGKVIVNAGLQILGGTPPDKALQNTVTSLVASEVINPTIAKEVNGMVDNPTIQKMVTNAGTSLTNGVLQGKSADEIGKLVVGSATGSLANSVGGEVSQKVLANIDDPTIAKIASDAAGAGTTALIKGQDAGKAALKSAEEGTLNAAGDVIGKNLPELPPGVNVDLSGLKEAIKPISDVATKFAQPISDVATKALQPVEGAIKGAAQGASDVATKVLQPAEGAIKGAAQKASDVVTSATEPLRQGFQSASDALTSATKPVSDTLSSAGDTIKSAGSGNFDKSVIDMMNKAPTANQPAVSNVATGGEGSAAAYGGADVAMLGDTSQAGLGSKVSKKGGKYPWGEPEGTSALKEGLGV